MRSRLWWAVCAYVCALLVLAAPARASWLDLELFAGDTIVNYAAQAQLAPDGRAYRVWVEKIGTGASTAVAVSQRAPGGAWEAPDYVSLTDATAKSPRLAVSDDGHATVAWTGCSAGKCLVHAASRLADGGWSPDLVVSNVEASGHYDLAVAADGLGNAVVSWSRELFPGAALMASRFNGTAWDQPKDFGVAADTDGGFPQQLVMNARGDAVLLWSRWLDGHPEPFAAVREGGAAWEPAERLSTPETEVNVYDPRMALAENGTAMAVWRCVPCSGVRFSVRPRSGSWSASADIPQSAIGGIYFPEYPDVALDPAGRAVVAWDVLSTQTQVLPTVKVAERSAAGAWTTPKTISSPDQIAMGARVATLPGGRAAVTWTARPEVQSNYLGTAVAAISSSPGVWGPLKIFTKAQGDPRVQADQAGNALITWPPREPTYTALASQLYDGAAPFVDGVSVPADARPGEALSMSAFARDDWSPPATLRWSFGDGAMATGENVKHTYASAGTYTVTIEGTDARANAVTLERTVTVRVPDAPVEIPTVIPDVVLDPPPSGPPAKTTVVPKPAAKKKLPSLTVLWVTRAYLQGGGKSLGKLLGVTGIEGLPAGTRVRVRCVAACKLDRGYDSKKGDDASKLRLKFSPAVAVTAKSVIEVRATRSGYESRAVKFKFARKKGALLARKL
jgi:hypothetical protein